MFLGLTAGEVTCLEIFKLSVFKVARHIQIPFPHTDQIFERSNIQFGGRKKTGKHNFRKILLTNIFYKVHFKLDKKGR